MLEQNPVYSALENCAIGVNIRRVDEIYSALSAELRRFTAKGIPSCPPGCGSCCEGFEPDIYPAEADYLAAHLLEKAPRLLSLTGASPRERGCPLYDPDIKEHCPAYAARPLICRSFAFSAFADKHGVPVFRLCARMESPEGPAGRRWWRGEGIREAFGAAAPIMEHYGRMIELLGGCPASREPLGRAVSIALDKIRYHISRSRTPFPEDDIGAA